MYGKRYAYFLRKKPVINKMTNELPVAVKTAPEVVVNQEIVDAPVEMATDQTGENIVEQPVKKPVKKTVKKAGQTGKTGKQGESKRKK